MRFLICEYIESIERGMYMIDPFLTARESLGVVVEARTQWDALHIAMRFISENYPNKCPYDPYVIPVGMIDVQITIGFITIQQRMNKIYVTGKTYFGKGRADRE